MKTKLDHIYGNTGGANQQELEALKNQVTSLSNIAAKTNLANVFTTHQTIRGYVKESAGLYKDGQSQPIATMKHQSQKDFFINFIQDSAGFRNYSNLNIRHRYGNQNDSQYVTLFQLQFRDTGTGAFIACEGNKLSFINETSIINVANPTANNHVANKAYVDSKAVPNFTLLQNWTGAFKDANLTWTKTQEFATAGNYEFLITVKNGDWSYIYNQILNIENLTKQVNGASCWFNYANKNAAAIQTAPNSGFWLNYDNKKISICKFGTNQPQANTSVNIYYRKLG